MVAAGRPVLRSMRFQNLMFLFLSIAFFFVPESQQGMQTLIFNTGQFRWVERAGTLSPETVDRLARHAEQNRDARGLAFAALHTAGAAERRKREEGAIALDRQWTWLLWAPGASQPNPNREDDERRLQAWDPSNSIYYCYHAQRLFETGNLGRFVTTGKDWPAALAKETIWREVMDKAFTAPRYESYMLQRFDLERSELRAHRLE